MNLTNNDKKSYYDWDKYPGYKKCPFCSTEAIRGCFEFGHWSREYECGTITTVCWSIDEYKVSYSGDICAKKYKTFWLSKRKILIEKKQTNY